MKLKSLILGSVAAAGLSTAGFAADLGVLTSLDVCDSLGISGLTISSSDNCLQITGGVSYEFQWGDYRGSFPVTGILGGGAGGTVRDTMDNDGVSPSELDWQSKLESWLKFVGTASSDFGPASVTIKLKDVQYSRTQNEGVANLVAGVPSAVVHGDDTGGVIVDEAYVSIGDTTTIMAGKKGSIANFGDDEPFNFLGLFGSDWADKGVKWDILDGNLDTGGHVIQVVSAVADGVTIKAGLENLNDSIATHAGTAVGVLEYAGEGITAHVTGLAGGILDGTVEAWAMHAGITGTFDAFKVRGAFAVQNTTAATAWHGLVSVEGTFDMFKIALSGEALNNSAVGANTDFGFGGSIGATVTEGVSINLGGKYFDSNNGGADGYQIAAQLVAAVSETVKVTGEVGVFGNVTASTTDFYGAAELAWAPGGGFTSSIKGEAHQNGAYKVTFKAAKEFK